MVLGEDAVERKSPLYFVAGVGDGGLDRAFDLARSLRGLGQRVEVSYSCGSLRSQLKRADRLGAETTIIAGEDEAQRGAVTVRNMKNGEQEEVCLTDIAKHIKENL